MSDTLDPVAAYAHLRAQFKQNVTVTAPIGVAFCTVYDYAAQLQRQLRTTDSILRDQAARFQAEQAGLWPSANVVLSLEAQRQELARAQHKALNAAVAPAADDDELYPDRAGGY